LKSHIPSSANADTEQAIAHAATTQLGLGEIIGHHKMALTAAQLVQTAKKRPELF
jgi:hypothetical protein